MHRWYVKARYQEGHDERSAALGCDLVLEDTSPPVNSEDALPHVIVQVGRLADDGEYSFENLIFLEPVEKSTLDAIPDDDPFPDEDSM
jgi:hypothetical protein